MSQATINQFILQEKPPKQRKPILYSDVTMDSFDVGFNVDVGTEFDTLFEGQRVVHIERHAESFSHIVDLDSFEYHKIVFHEFLSDILQSAFFRLGILFLVLLNALLLGIQTVEEYFLKYNSLFQCADQIILGVFVFEILIKWIYDFKLFWKVYWNILDSIIVGAIILSAVVPHLNKSKFLVIVRVVRAFRSLRSVSSLTSLTIVSHTVIKSIIDMANILLVLILFMTVMSVMGVTLFDVEGINSVRFLSALEAWFAIFICVTQDGWQDLLGEMKNQRYYSLLCAYLMISVSIGAFVFANLIVAVIVANLELSVRELRQEKQLSDNPLDLKGQFSVHELQITPTYDIFAENSTGLRAQRPIKLPNFRNLSARQLHGYIMLVVALEQNMLEADLIRSDMERIMSVQLCIMHQLGKLTPGRNKDNVKRGTSLMNKYGSLGVMNYHSGTLQRMESLVQIKKIKKLTEKQN